MPDPSPDAYEAYRRGIITRHITCAGRYLSEVWLRELRPENGLSGFEANQRDFQPPVFISDFGRKTKLERARSGGSPALVDVHGQLWLAWRGTSNGSPRLRIASLDAAANVASSVTLEEKSDFAPALGFFRGKFYLAWTGRDRGQHLNLLTSHDGMHWGNKRTFYASPEARSGGRPALLAARDRLWLAWRGTNDDHPYLWMMYTEDGEDWQGKIRILETSDLGPSLAWFKDRYYIAWTGRDHEGHVNVMSSDDGGSWSDKKTLRYGCRQARSAAEPALVASPDRLHLMWRGSNDDHPRILSMFTRDGHLWIGKDRMEETTDYGPAMVLRRDRAFVAWTGRDDDHHVNVYEAPLLQDEPARVYVPWVDENNSVHGGGDNPLLRGGLAMAAFAAEYRVTGTRSSLEYAERLLSYFEKSEATTHGGELTGFFLRCRHSSFTREIEQYASQDEIVGMVLGLYHLYIAAETSNEKLAKRVQQLTKRLAKNLQAHGYLIFPPHDTGLPLKFHRGSAGLWFFEWALGNAFERITGNRHESTLATTRDSTRRIWEETKGNVPDDVLAVIYLWKRHGRMANSVAGHWDEVIQDRFHVDTASLLIGVGLAALLGLLPGAGVWAVLNVTVSSVIEWLRDPYRRYEKTIGFYSSAVYSGLMSRSEWFNLALVRHTLHYGLDHVANVGARSGGSPALCVGNDSLVLAWRGENDSRPRLYVAQSDDGARFRDKVRVGETSNHGPAIAFFRGKHYLAWTGRNRRSHVNLISSADGISWSGKQTLNGGDASARSGGAPALLAADGRLWLAWRGTNDDRPRLRVMHSHSGTHWQGKVTLQETSDHGPALAFFNGRYYLAWTGRNDNQNVNLISSPNGSQWGNKIVLNTDPSARSDGAPVLTVHDGKLWLSWRGTNDDHPYLYVMSTADGVRWSGKVRLSETSDFGPAMAPYRGVLRLAWTGRDDKRHINLISSSDGGTWSSKKTLYDRSNDLAHAAANFLKSVLGSRLFADHPDVEFYAAVLAKGLVGKHVQLDYLNEVERALESREAMWPELPAGEPEEVRLGEWPAPVRWHNSRIQTEDFCQIGLDFCWEKPPGKRTIARQPGTHPTSTGLSGTVVKQHLSSGRDALFETGGLDFFLPRALMGLWLGEPLHYKDERLQPVRAVTCLPFRRKVMKEVAGFVEIGCDGVVEAAPSRVAKPREPKVKQAVLD